MHIPAFLGGHDVAGDLRLDTVTLNQQVADIAMLDTGKCDLEATGTLECCGAHDVEKRDQGLAVLHGAGQDVGQTLPCFYRHAA